MTCSACRRQYLVVFALFVLILLGVVAKAGADPQQGRLGWNGVGVGESCDLAELLAASRAWLPLMGQSVYQDAADQFEKYIRGRMSRAELGALLDARMTAEVRWRAAVEACR